MKIGGCGDGNHRTLAIILNQQPFYKEVKVYDDSEYFRYVRKDGYWWYQISNNQVLGKVFDYKVAIIFELEKEIYSL